MTTTVDAVTEGLRGEILSGERPAGARLVEQELCAHFGVARHSLRAALRALQAEGLVQVETNRGARVAHLDVQDIVQLYELRTALEVEAARLALERHGGQIPVRDALARLTHLAKHGGWGESTPPTPACTVRSSRPPSHHGSKPRTARWTAS